MVKLADDALGKFGSGQSLAVPKKIKALWQIMFGQKSDQMPYLMTWTMKMQKNWFRLS